MSWLLAIAGALGRFLREVLPAILSDIRKPRKTHVAGKPPGFDEKVRDEIRRDRRPRRLP